MTAGVCASGLKLQRKIIREVILTFAKVHSTTDLPTPPHA